MPQTGPVLLFCAALGGDGVARNTVHLANALAARGTSVAVACLTEGPLAADLRGVPLIRLGRAPGPRWLALALAAPRLRRALAETRAAVVVSMGNHAHLAVWAALRGLRRVARVYRISNDPLHGGGVDPCGPMRAATLALVAADATRIACVSEAIARRAPLRRARLLHRLEAIPNGVDAGRIAGLASAPCDHPWLSDEAPYLVAVGRLHPQKNYPAIIEALALARAAGRPRLRLLVLGRAPRRARRRLERLAAALGVADAVRFEGEVANPIPLLARAAAYVLPSRWEGASNSLLEALACGVPIVAARTAGNAPEVLADGRYGVLAAPEPADLARAILQQLDPARRVLPEQRAVDLSLASSIERMCAVIAGASAAHDENQMERAGRGHLPALHGRIGGAHTEY